MKGGSIRLTTPDEVYKQPASQFVASFIGSPAMNFATGEISNSGRKTVLETESGAAITLASCHVAQGRRVHLGFRPEHMQLADAARPPKGNISISGDITVVEPMGHETVLTCDGGFGEIVGKYEGEKHFRPGETVQFHIRTDRLHFFDLETGVRL